MCYTDTAVKELWRDMWEANPSENSFIIDDATALIPDSILLRCE